MVDIIFGYLCLPGKSIVLYFCWTVLILFIGVYVYVSGLPLPTMQEIWVQSLGREDPLEEEMATQPSILAWRIPWMEEPGGLQSMGSQTLGED